MRLFGAQSVSMFGDRMVGVALAFAVLELGGSATDVGLVLAMRSLPLVACLLVGGVVADRVSRRTVLMSADLVRLASQGVLAGLLIAGRPSVLIVGLLSGVTGAGSGFAAPATTGLMPEVVAPEELQDANGMRATAFSAGELGGPLLSGVLVAAAGPGWALAADAATFGASATLLLGLRLSPRSRRLAGTFLGDLRDGWRTFRSLRWLWTFVLWASVANLLFGAFKVLGPVISHEELGGGAVWGAILAAMGAGTILGGLLALRARPRRPLRMCAGTAFLFAAPVGALAATTSAPLIALGAFLAGLSLMLGNTLWETIVQRHVPPESLSRVSSYDWFGSIALDPVGLAIWGPIAALIGITAALWTSFAMLVASALALFAVPEIRRFPA